MQIRITNTQKYFLDRTYRSSVVLNVLLITILAVVFDIRVVAGVVSNFTPIIIVALWYVSTLFVVNNPVLIFTKKESVWWIVMLLLEVIMVLLEFSSIGINNIFIRIPVYFIPIIMSFVLRFYHYGEKVLLLIFLFLAVLFNILKSDIVGFYNPWMFESLTASVDGFAASSTTYTAVTLFFLAICFIMLKNIKSKHIRIVLWFSIGASSYYFFVLNSRGTAFFLLVVLLTGFFFSTKHSFKSIKPLYIFLFILLLLLIIFLLFNPIIDVLSFVFKGNERMLTRINDLSYFAQSQDMYESGSVGSRIQLGLISLHTWLSDFSNFFFGIGEHPVYYQSLVTLEKAGVGQHSQFLDHLAQYGLVGGLILYKALKNTFGFILIRAHNTKMYNRTFIVLLVFILYSFLNNSLIGNILFVVFLLLPLIVDILASKKNMIYE